MKIVDPIDRLARPGPMSAAPLSFFTSVNPTTFAHAASGAWTVVTPGGGVGGGGRVGLGVKPFLGSPGQKVVAWPVAARACDAPMYAPTLMPSRCDRLGVPGTGNGPRGAVV